MFCYFQKTKMVGNKGRHTKLEDDPDFVEKINEKGGGEVG